MFLISVLQKGPEELKGILLGILGPILKFRKKISAALIKIKILRYNLYGPDDDNLFKISELLP